MTDGRDARAYGALLAIINSLVDRSEAIVVDAVPTEKGVTFHIHVAAEDVGKLIGRQGRNARAIRDVIGAIGAKAKRTYTVDIVQSPVDGA